MNILCICEGGNSRSVGLAQVLKTEHYHNAIAVGTMYAFNANNGREPGTMLSRWADRIVFMADYIMESARECIPEDCRHKIRLCEVGKDVYSRPYDQSLVDQCRAKALEIVK